jgi:glycosyltransferase involved in cell wall biosynthesis
VTDALQGVADEDQLSLAFLGDPNSIHTRRWIHFFAERGHRVTLLVPRDKPVEPGLLPSIEIEPFTSLAARRRLPPASLLCGRRSVRQAVARIRPDVLNAHFLTVYGWHAWVSGFHPYVITLWGSDVFIAPRRSRLAAALGRISLRAADMVMVNSEALKRGAVAIGARPNRLAMIQWGVDLAKFRPGPDPSELRGRLGLQGRRVVFSPRAITPLYRQTVVVRALAELPSDVVVVMARHSARPGELEAVEREVNTLGLAERVVIVDDIGHAEMPEFYRLADVVVSVPESDSTSVTVLEALASGLPIVASNLPSMREWLSDLDPSLLVPVDDPAATAAALSRALGRDRRTRAELAGRARAIVAERADEARSLAHVEHLYRQLARHGRAGPPGMRRRHEQAPRT